MTFLFFLFQTIVISLSGVMAPGPITAATVGTGTKSPHAGALVAVGHGIVEIPLIISFMFGIGYIVSLRYVRVSILLAGGLFLLFMGYDMLRNIHKNQGAGSITPGYGPLAAGILLTAGNVYFLLWWATVGASLITRAVAFGLAGLGVFIAVHWLCDFVWLYILSAASFRGGTLWGEKFRRIVFSVCAVLLGVFGVTFVVQAARILAP
jgi:threonine/homoserine/homoserine lactone efflux protein